MLENAKNVWLENIWQEAELIKATNSVGALKGQKM